MKQSNLGPTRIFSANLTYDAAREKAMRDWNNKVADKEIEIIDNKMIACSTSGSDRVILSIIYKEIE